MCDGVVKQSERDRVGEPFADGSFIARDNSPRDVEERSDRERSVSPSLSIAYPKANLYYAFAEDTHPATRIATVSKLFEEERLSSRSEPSAVQAPRPEDRAADRYLETCPPSFVVFGKPGLNGADVASAMADAWNCVSISPASLIQREIDAGTETGLRIERNRRLGGRVEPEVVTDLMRRRIGMRDVKHRGYVVAGLPLVPADASFDRSTCSTYTLNTDSAEFCGNAADERREACEARATSYDCPNTFDGTGCKVRTDPELEISRQINEIFTAWPIKSLIIVYMICPRRDIASRCARLEATTDSLADEYEYTEQPFDDESESESEESDVSFDLRRDADERSIAPDDRGSRSSRRISDVEARCDLYERFALPVIDERILAHDPQRVIRVDGRSSVQRTLHILDTRLRVLSLQSPILPKRMIERDDALLVEASSELGAGDDEPAEKSAEEAFRVLSRRDVVSPRFPWRLSAWKFYCPVELARGRTVRGLARYSVLFLGEIFFLSSRSAESAFVENPRTFLLSPNPRPTCKTAVFGPKYAGKSELCAKLAEVFGGTVINVERITRESVELRDDSSKESANRELRENYFDAQTVPDRAKRARDGLVDASADERADVIARNIKEIPGEKLEDELWRDGGYIVDGMYADIEVWRRVVDDAGVAFEDIVVLFEDEPYVRLLDKFRGFSRPDDSAYEADYDAGMEDREEDEMSREEREYLEHLERFDSEWARFEEYLSEFGGNVIRCNLADTADAAEYVIDNFKRRFDAATIVTIAERKKEEEEEDIFEQATVTDDKTSLANDERERGYPAYAVDLETAEQLLGCGYFFLSPFGRWCPVQMYNGQIPIQMFLPMRNRGQIFPVVRDSYVYFLAGEEALSAFLSDPTKYLARKTSLPLLPLRISVVGPPKCGKTTLARRFAETYGVKRIARDEALRHMSKRYGWSESARIVKEQLRKGDAVSIESVTRAVETLTIGARAASQGYILDDCPSDREEAERLALLGIQPMIVLDLKADLQFCLECFSSDNDDRPPNSSTDLLSRRYAQWQTRHASFRNWLDKFSRNTIELDAARSKWHVWTRADRAVRSRFASIVLYARDADLDKVHRLRYMCVSPFEFRSRQSRYKSYCPVCLFREDALKSSDQPTDSRGMVQFREHFYWICPRHTDVFARDPSRHLPPVNTASLPAELPRALRETVDVEHACWARRLQVDGLCTVTYVDGLPERKLTRGRVDLAVLFKDKVYLLCSEECRDKFLARPGMYSEACVASPRELSPIDARRLPDLDFLRRTVARAIVEAVNLVAARRPKVFGLSAAVSAAIYIGVHLKTRGTSEGSSEADVYEAASKRMAERDKIIKSVTDIMKKKLNPYVSLPKRPTSEVEE